MSGGRLVVPSFFFSWFSFFKKVVGEGVGPAIFRRAGGFQAGGEARGAAGGAGEEDLGPAVSKVGGLVATELVALRPELVVL